MNVQYVNVLKWKHIIRRVIFHLLEYYRFANDIPVAPIHSIIFFHSSRIIKWRGKKIPLQKSRHQPSLSFLPFLFLLTIDPPGNSMLLPFGQHTSSTSSTILDEKEEYVHTNIGVQTSCTQSADSCKIKSEKTLRFRMECW